MAWMSRRIIPHTNSRSTYLAAFSVILVGHLSISCEFGSKRNAECLKLNCASKADDCVSNKKEFTESTGDGKNSVILAFEYFLRMDQNPTLSPS